MADADVLDFLLSFGALFLDKDSFFSSNGIDLPQLLLSVLLMIQLEPDVDSTTQFFLRFHNFVTSQLSPRPESGSGYRVRAPIGACVVHYSSFFLVSLVSGCVGVCFSVTT